jgi:transcriptional regulator with XRE-family HTH domain
MSKQEALRIVGRRLKVLRKQRGLSQEKLAEMVGKSVDAISSIERGVSTPLLETVYDLSVVLGVRLFDLYREEDEGLGVDELPTDVQELVHLIRKQPDSVRSAILDQSRITVALVDGLKSRKAKA